MATYSPTTGNVAQLGRESTAGTAVAATVLWRGEASSIEDGAEVTMAAETVGILAPTGRSYIAQALARYTQPESDATFEQLPHIFEASILTATPTGAGPYVYDYPQSVTTPGTIKTYTIETGNKIDNAGESAEMEYSFVQSYTLSGRINEPWKVGPVNWVGRQRTVATLTSLSVPSVEEMLFNKTTVYLDDSGGTIGTTALGGVVLDASINIENTGLVPVFTADGTLYFGTHKRVMPSGTLSMTLEMNSDDDVAAIRAKRNARTVQLVRFSVAGSSARAATFDAAVLWQSVGTVQDSDGNATVQVEGAIVYSSADALFWNPSVTNNLTTLP